MQSRGRTGIPACRLLTEAAARTERDQGDEESILAGLQKVVGTESTDYADYTDSDEGIGYMTKHESGRC